MTRLPTDSATRLSLPLRTLAPAKINLGLFVGGVRSDGRHELVSVMQSISLADELTLERADGADGGTRTPVGAGGTDGGERTPTRAGGADEIVSDGPPELAGPHNLAARALRAFRAETGWEWGPLRLTITKRIPVAAGMGGGSADAAATLRLAARARGSTDEELLQRLAVGLGADVPAQIKPGRWLALGAGERLHALPDPPEPFGVLVLPLAERLSTAAVYAQADRLGIARNSEQLRERCERLREVLAPGAQLPPQDLLANDLQAAAISLCPGIEPALTQALEVGADVALVSGSGPTVLGLFGGSDGPGRARRAAAGLRERRPPALVAVPAGAELANVVSVRNNERLNPQR